MMFSFVAVAFAQPEVIVVDPVVVEEVIIAEEVGIVDSVQGLPFGEALAALLILLGFFSAIARITPWKWDNKILNFIQALVNKLGLSGKQPPK